MGSAWPSAHAPPTRGDQLNGAEIATVDSRSGSGANTKERIGSCLGADGSEICMRAESFVSSGASSGANFAELDPLCNEARPSSALAVCVRIQGELCAH